MLAPHNCRWHWINLPGCLEGKVAGISADDDELVIISHDARIFTLDRISDSPRQWNLSNLWGFPFWFAPGQRLPETWDDGWSLSVNTPLWDGHYLDSAGRQHNVGDGRMTMITALTGDGSEIAMVDP